jgi:hypothetical protein
VQVALEQVYEVLRSENPLEPAQRLLGAFVEDIGGSGRASAFAAQRAIRSLRDASVRLGPAPASPASVPQTLISVDEIESLLDRHGPTAPANAAAMELLRIAIRIRRDPAKRTADRALALISLCQKVAVASAGTAMEAPSALAEIRDIVREEVSRLDGATHQPRLDQAILLQGELCGRVPACKLNNAVA